MIRSIGRLSRLRMLFLVCQLPMHTTYSTLIHRLDTELYDRIQAFKVEREVSKLASANVMDETLG